MTWAPVLQWAGISAFGLMVLMTMRPRRSNRRHNLPPPDSRTQRSPDWRRYELHTPRKYIP